MSLILEALKKSEAERRLGEAPHLGTLPVWAPPRPVSKAWWALLPLLVVVGAAAWSNRDLIGGKPELGDDIADSGSASSAPPTAPAAAASTAAVPVSTQAVPLLSAPAAPVNAGQSGPPAAFANRSGPSPTSARPPRPMPDPLPLPQSMDDLDAMKDVSPENRRRLESGELFVANPQLLAERGPTTETQIISADAALPPPLDDLPADGAPLTRDQQAALEQAKFAKSLDRARAQSQVAPRPAATAPTASAMPTPPPRPSSAAPAPPSAAPAPGAPLPLIHDLTMGQRQGLPALKMSVHFYNSDVARRFVIIDGQRLNEGGVMGQELWAREIRTDGVVIEYRGVYFLLPRIGG